MTDSTNSLDELTNDLNVALALAEQRLARLDLKVSAFITLREGGKLHWKKHQDTWGLFVEVPSTGLTSIAKTGRKIRIEAAGALKELHKALFDERAAQIEAAKAAIKSIDSFLDELDEANPEEPGT